MLVVAGRESKIGSADMFRRRIFLVGGVMVAGYGTSLIYRSLSPPFPRVFHTNSDPNYVPQTTEERREIFDQIAPKYDRAMKFPEWLWGIKAYRKMLIQQAKGKVLEVGVGTGANLPYYSSNNGRVTSVDAIDASQPMLDQAQLAYDAIKNAPAQSSAATPSSNSTSNASATAFTLPTSITTTGPPSPPIIFTLMSTEALTFPSGSFDSVIDAYGLTSYADPRAALSEMIRVTRHDGRGRILLLESGRSNQYEWLNYLLDYRAKKYARASGSDLNRNIEELVNLFQKSGDIRVINKRVFHFGTSYLYVLGVTNNKDQKDARQQSTAPPGKFVPPPRLVGIELNPGPSPNKRPSSIEDFADPPHPSKKQQQLIHIEPNTSPILPPRTPAITHTQSTLSENVNLTSDLSSYSPPVTQIVPGRLLKDMIHLIDSYLNDHDWVSSMQLCHHWLTCGASSPTRRLCASYDITDTHDPIGQLIPPRYLSHHFTSLSGRSSNHLSSRAERFRRSGLTSRGLVSISQQLPYLTSLSTEMRQFDSTRDVIDVTWPGRLIELDLISFELDNPELISSIWNCRMITKLSLHGFMYHHKDMAILEGLNQLIHLESLSLRIECAALVDDRLDLLVAMKLTHLPTRLKYFNFCDGHHQFLSLTTLAQMTPAVELEEMYLRGRLIQPDELKLIHQFAPNLKRMEVHNCHLSNFTTLIHFSALQHFHINAPNNLWNLYPIYESALVSGLAAATQLTSINFDCWRPTEPASWLQLSRGLIHLSSLEFTFIRNLISLDVLQTFHSLTSLVFKVNLVQHCSTIRDFFQSAEVMPHLLRISIRLCLIGCRPFVWVAGEIRKDNYRAKEIVASPTTGAAADAHPPHPPLVGIELNPGPFSTTAGSMIDTIDIATIDPLNTTSTNLSRVSGGTLFKDGLHSIYTYLTPQEFMSALHTCHHWCRSAYSTPTLHFNYLDLSLNSDVYDHDQISVHSPLNYHFTRLTDSNSRVVESFDFIDLVPLLPHLTTIEMTLGLSGSDATSIDHGWICNIWPTRLQSLTLHFPLSKPVHSPNLVESIWRIHSLTQLTITHTGINSVFSSRLLEGFDPAVTMCQLIHLTDFTLTSSERLTDAFKPDYRTHALALPTSVTSLEIDGEYFLSSTLKCPPHIYSHLHRLRFHRDRRVALQVGDLARLAQLMPNVESLAELCFTSISTDFQAITQFHRLTSLELAFVPPQTRVNESMIRSLGQLQSLTHLTLLADTFAIPTDWELLSQLAPSIISLNLVCVDPCDQFPHIVQYLSSRLIRLTLTPSDLTPASLDLLSQCSSLVELVIDVSECRWGEYNQIAAFKLAWDYFNDANHLPQLIYLRLSSEPWELDWIYDRRTGRNFWTYRRPPTTPTTSSTGASAPPAPPLIGVEMNPGPDSITHAQSTFSENVNLTSDLSSYSPPVTQIVPGRLLKDMIHLILSFLNDVDWISCTHVSHHWQSCGASSSSRHLSYLVPEFDVIPTFPPYRLLHHFTSIKFEGRQVVRVSGVGVTPSQLFTLSTQLPYLTRISCTLLEVKSENEPIHSGGLIMIWPIRLNTLELNFNGWISTKLISSIFDCLTIKHLVLVNISPAEDMAIFEAVNQLIDLESLSLSIDPTMFAFAMMSDREYIDLLREMRLTHLPLHLKYFSLCAGDGDFLFLGTLVQMTPAVELEEIALLGRVVDPNELELLHSFAPNLKRFGLSACDPSNFISLKLFHSLQHLHLHPPRFMLRNFPTYESSLVQGLIAAPQLSSIHWDSWIPVESDSWSQLSHGLIHLSSIEFTGINHHAHLSLNVLRPFPSLTSCVFNADDFFCQPIIDFFRSPEVMPQLQHIYVSRKYPAAPFEWWTDQTRNDNYRSKAVGQTTTVTAAAPPTDRESTPVKLNASYAPPLKDLTREGVEQNPGPVHSWRDIAASRVVDINPDSGPLTAATPLLVGVASNLDLISAAASSTPSIPGPSLTHPLTTPHPITTSSTASSSLHGTSMNTSQTLFKDGLHSIFTFLSLRDLIHSVRTCRSWQAGSMRIPYHYLEIPVANQHPQVPPYYRANYHLVRVKNVTLSPKQVMNICQQLPTIIHFSFQLDVNTKDHVVSDLGKTEVIEWPSTLTYLTVDLNQYDLVDNSLPRFYSAIFSARSVVKLKLLGLGQFFVQRSFSLLPQLSQLTSFTTVGSTDASSQPQRILHCFTSHQLHEMKELDLFHGAYLDLTIFTKKAAPNLKEINFLRYPFATYPSHLDLCAQTLPHLRVLRAGGLPLDRLARIGQLFPQLHTLGIYGHSRNWSINGHLIRASLISASKLTALELNVPIDKEFWSVPATNHLPSITSLSFGSLSFDSSYCMSEWRLNDAIQFSLGFANRLKVLSIQAAEFYRSEAQLASLLLLNQFLHLKSFTLHQFCSRQKVGTQHKEVGFTCILDLLKSLGLYDQCERFYYHVFGDAAKEHERELKSIHTRPSVSVIPPAQRLVGIELNPGPSRSDRYRVGPSTTNVTPQTIFKDALHIIYSYLPPSDFFSALQTCHHWSVCAVTCPSLHFIFTLESDGSVKMPPPAHLRHHITRLKSRENMRPAVSTKQLFTISQIFPSIQEFNVSITDTDDNVEHVEPIWPRGLTKIDLYLSQSKFPNLIQPISTCTTLTVLSIWRISRQVDFSLFTYIQHLPLLQNLTLTVDDYPPSTIDVLELMQLNQLPQALTYLNICYGFPSELSLTTLARMYLPHLTDLNLASRTLTVTDIKFLVQCAPNLSDFSPDSFEMNVFGELNRFKSIRSIYISQFYSSDATVTADVYESFVISGLCACPLLNSIGLGEGRPQRPDSWKQLADSLPHLSRLQLTWGTKDEIKPESLDVFLQFHQLTDLSIRDHGSRVVEDYFRSPLVMPQLKRIHIGWDIYWDVKAQIGLQNYRLPLTQAHSLGTPESASVSPTSPTMGVEEPPAARLVGIETNPGPQSHHKNWSDCTAWISERDEWNRLKDPTSIYLTLLMDQTDLIKDLVTVVLAYLEPPDYHKPRAHCADHSGSWLIPFPHSAQPIAVAFQLVLTDVKHFESSSPTPYVITQFHGKLFEEDQVRARNTMNCSISSTSKTSSAAAPVWSFNKTNQIGIVELHSNSRPSTQVGYGLLLDPHTMELYHRPRDKRETYMHSIIKLCHRFPWNWAHLSSFQLRRQIPYPASITFTFFYRTMNKSASSSSPSLTSADATNLDTPWLQLPCGHSSFRQCQQRMNSMVYVHYPFTCMDQADGCVVHENACIVPRTPTLARVDRSYEEVRWSYQQAKRRGIEAVQQWKDEFKLVTDAILFERANLFNQTWVKYPDLYLGGDIPVDDDVSNTTLDQLKQACGQPSPSPPDPPINSSPPIDLTRYGIEPNPGPPNKRPSSVADLVDPPHPSKKQRQTIPRPAGLVTVEDIVTTGMTTMTPHSFFYDGLRSIYAFLSTADFNHACQTSRWWFDAGQSGPNRQIRIDQYQQPIADLFSQPSIAPRWSLRRHIRSCWTSNWRSNLPNLNCSVRALNRFFTSTPHLVSYDGSISCEDLQYGVQLQPPTSLVECHLQWRADRYHSLALDSQSQTIIDIISHVKTLTSLDLRTDVGQIDLEPLARLPHVTTFKMDTDLRDDEFRQLIQPLNQFKALTSLSIRSGNLNRDYDLSQYDLVQLHMPTVIDFNLDLTNLNHLKLVELSHAFPSLTQLITYRPIYVPSIKLCKNVRKLAFSRLFSETMPTIDYPKPLHLLYSNERQREEAMAIDHLIGAHLPLTTLHFTEVIFHQPISWSRLFTSIPTLTSLVLETPQHHDWTTVLITLSQSIPKQLIQLRLESWSPIEGDIIFSAFAQFDHMTSLELVIYHYQYQSYETLYQQLNDAHYLPQLNYLVLTLPLTKTRFEYNRSTGKSCNFYRRTKKPVCAIQALPMTDLTREGIEPNPGPPSQNKRSSSVEDLGNPPQPSKKQRQTLPGSAARLIPVASESGMSRCIWSKKLSSDMFFTIGGFMTTKELLVDSLVVCRDWHEMIVRMPSQRRAYSCQLVDVTNHPSTTSILTVAENYFHSRTRHHCPILWLNGDGREWVWDVPQGNCMHLLELAFGPLVTNCPTRGVYPPNLQSLQIILCDGNAWADYQHEIKVISSCPLTSLRVVFNTYEFDAESLMAEDFFDSLAPSLTSLRFYTVDWNHHAYPGVVGTDEYDRGGKRLAEAYYQPVMSHLRKFPHLTHLILPEGAWTSRDLTAFLSDSNAGSIAPLQQMVWQNPKDWPQEPIQWIPRITSLTDLSFSHFEGFNQFTFLTRLPHLRRLVVSLECKESELIKNPPFPFRPLIDSLLRCPSLQELFLMNEPSIQEEEVQQILIHLIHLRALSIYQRSCAGLKSLRCFDLSHVPASSTVDHPFPYALTSLSFIMSTSDLALRDLTYLYQWHHLKHISIHPLAPIYYYEDELTELSPLLSPTITPDLQQIWPSLITYSVTTTKPTLLHRPPAAENDLQEQDTDKKSCSRILEDEN